MKIFMHYKRLLLFMLHVKLQIKSAFVALIKKNSEVPSCSRIADNFKNRLKEQMLAKKVLSFVKIL